MVQITRKRINKVFATYTLEGTVLENVHKIKYLGIKITNDGTLMYVIYAQRQTELFAS